MQVEEVSAEGLKRAYRVVIPAAEIENRVQTRLKRLSQTVRMPGFRPGKAPITLLRKQYGRSVMGEILEQAVDEGSRKAIEDNQLRPALRPKVEVTSFDEGQDLEFAVNLEVLPEVPKVELGEIALERPVVEVDDAKVDEAIERLAKSRQEFAPPADLVPEAMPDETMPPPVAPPPVAVPLAGSPAEDRDAILLNFEQADIREVIYTFAAALNVNYWLDPRVQGQVIARSFGPIYVDDLYPVFLQILRSNGFAAVKQGDLYMIVPADVILSMTVKDTPEDAAPTMTSAFAASRRSTVGFATSCWASPESPSM